MKLLTKIGGAISAVALGIIWLVAFLNLTSEYQTLFIFFVIFAVIFGICALMGGISYA